MTERNFACIQQIGPWSVMSEVWRADNEGIIEGTGTSPQGGACEFTWIDRAAVSVC